MTERYWLEFKVKFPAGLCLFIFADFEDPGLSRGLQLAERGAFAGFESFSRRASAAVPR